MRPSRLMFGAAGGGVISVNVIEVFADVRCPFTHVGLRRLVEERDRVGRRDLQLRVRAWPLELVNAEPLSAALIAAEVTELRAQVTPDLFAGFDVARFPASSLPAMGLAAIGYEHDPSVGESVSLLLRDAFFEHGRDISSASVLDDLASRAGIERSLSGGERQVRADWEEGVSRGVIGSPHFFVGDADFFCPSLEITHVGEELRIRFDEHGFATFLRHCLT